MSCFQCAILRGHNSVGSLLTHAAPQQAGDLMPSLLWRPARYRSASLKRRSGRRDKANHSTQRELHSAVESSPETSQLFLHRVSSPHSPLADWCSSFLVHLHSITANFGGVGPGGSVSTYGASQRIWRRAKARAHRGEGEGTFRSHS